MRTRALLLAGLVVLVVAAVLLLRRTSSSPGETPAAGRHPGPGAAIAAGEPNTHPRASRARRGARTLVPRLLTTPRADAGAAGSPGTPPPRLERGGGLPRDRRPEAARNAPVNVVQIRERFREVDDAVERCLSRFAAEDPALAEGVMLAFTLDADGLQDVWIVDHENVSEGPLTCLSQAVYGVDWSGLTRDPLQVTRPMRARSDAGAGPG
jgi:hypothetical protein